MPPTQTLIQCKRCTKQQSIWMTSKSVQQTATTMLHLQQALLNDCVGERRKRNILNPCRNACCFVRVCFPHEVCVVNDFRKTFDEKIDTVNRLLRIQQKVIKQKPVNCAFSILMNCTFPVKSTNVSVMSNGQSWLHFKLCSIKQMGVAFDSDFFWNKHICVCFMQNP